MICLISFGKFLDVLPAFTFGSSICNLLRICLGLNILMCEWSETLCSRATRAIQAKSKGRPLPFCWLLKLSIFSTILPIFLDFSFSGVFY